MKLNLFIQNNCDFCAQLIIPEGIKVNKVNVDEDYNGYRPEQTPVLQAGKISIPGPDAINATLLLIKNAQDGDYKK